MIFKEILTLAKVLFDRKYSKHIIEQSERLKLPSSSISISNVRIVFQNGSRK